MTLGFPCWDQAPAHWDWLAQDEDGQWFWYGVQPSPGIGGGVWRSPSRMQQLAAKGEPNPAWMHSLYQRPDLPDKNRST
ncbi:hypothetical protein [Alcaligenes parafaecalis]|uniref:Uncharacterized protein n=1 Tax=Alcaligenes parafaecalis TaxID=171260 RepID=A0ABT3VNR2_9BURK|nr:hypothetical protein [Alcaligenes parafaecalis]MCX5464855.1 hypothetical protein [Alcaligenes parafaecalis]